MYTHTETSEILQITKTRWIYIYNWGYVQNVESHINWHFTHQMNIKIYYIVLKYAVMIIKVE
jgi:hypothetical protein